MLIVKYLTGVKSAGFSSQLEAFYVSIRTDES